MIEERVPPQNIEAEQAVLGAMLIDKEAIAKASEILTADDFYREAKRVAGTPSHLAVTAPFQGAQGVL